VSGSPLLSRPLMSGNKAARRAFECLARFLAPQPERADLPRGGASIPAGLFSRSTFNSGAEQAQSRPVKT
jgi:hypothetical protein